MGNRNWMRARESQLRSELIPGDLTRLFPICTPGASEITLTMLRLRLKSIVAILAAELRIGSGSKKAYRCESKSGRVTSKKIQSRSAGAINR